MLVSAGGLELPASSMAKSARPCAKCVAFRGHTFHSGVLAARCLLAMDATFLARAFQYAGLRACAAKRLATPTASPMDHGRALSEKTRQAFLASIGRTHTDRALE